MARDQNEVVASIFDAAAKDVDASIIARLHALWDDGRWAADEIITTIEDREPQ